MESSMDVADDTAPPRADEVEEGTLYFDDDDDDDDNAHSAWSKYEALKSKATALSAVEMDALAQWKWYTRVLSSRVHDDGVLRLNGRLGEAIDSYLELARTHPKYLHVHFKLGYLYLILQNYESAIQHLTYESRAKHE
ncbi:hypothetical protein DYB36_003523 [Aphanomyces astaci]|uniref:Uncharacterized protein n=1 Tax=Aphanomyces astaci TaxID=112090 RepID=A0A397B772_APHAT|nr:hypothetical protein DYB36_003523 [Aphanomyces astaci]